MLRSSTRAPEGLKYRSSGSGYSWAPLRGAKILKAPAPALQPELKMPYAPLRSAPAPERSETLNEYILPKQFHFSLKAKTIPGLS